MPKRRPLWVGSDTATLLRWPSRRVASTYHRSRTGVRL